MKRLAVLLPWFSFFLREKYICGYICLALQISLIGWPIASIWAIVTFLKSAAKSNENFVLKSLHPSLEKPDMAIKNFA